MRGFEDDDKFKRLVASVREAGAVLLSMWPRREARSDDLTVQQKVDGSLVSAADMASNELLTAALRTLYPNDFVFSEEVSSDPAEVFASQRTWIIDPLDGTSAFLEGRDDFSVLVGLVVGHIAHSGILYLPARDQMFTARAGAGAFCNGQPVRVSDQEYPRERHVYVRKFQSTAPHLESPMMDSGLALAKVAVGELDGAMIKMVTHREWDIAAPIAIIKEAGGQVTDELGREVPLSTGSIDFKYLVASNRRVHGALLKLLPE